MGGCVSHSPILCYSGDMDALEKEITVILNMHVYSERDHECSCGVRLWAPVAHARHVAALIAEML